MRFLPRFSIDKGRWMLIVGSGLNSGFSIEYFSGPRPPVADWRAWEFQWCLTFRWPVSFRIRRARLYRSRSL